MKCFIVLLYNMEKVFSFEKYLMVYINNGSEWIRNKIVFCEMCSFFEKYFMMVVN